MIKGFTGKSLIILLLIAIAFNTNASGGSVNEQVTQIIFIKDDNFSGNSLLYEAILELGYRADIIVPDSVTVDKLNQYELVVLSTGNNVNACQSMNMRLSLQTYIVDFSGKVLIEGGQTGYISAVLPFYLGFRNKVIMIDDWIADDGGDLMISPVHTLSDLANIPNVLPATFEVNYSDPGDQDVCTNSKFSQLFYRSSLYNNKVGILVSPSVADPRVINFFLYYSAFAFREEARSLLENSIFSLIGKPLGINDIDNETPSDFSLAQNYPNPFNPATVISYQIPGRSLVSLKIFDVLGSEIAEPVNENQSAGKYEVKWNAEGLSGGIYFYSLYIDGKLYQTQKMILLK
ncbi:MAG: T9SS type A sorting domain-containing protein [Ignavibacteria bacterium]|nr:T9SS type A sorting domain-containing protein [Ignavibacteria bacterium]